LSKVTDVCFLFFLNGKKTQAEWDGKKTEEGSEWSTSK
jgi:hypothetical protein